LSKYANIGTGTVLLTKDRRMMMDNANGMVWMMLFMGLGGLLLLLLVVLGIAALIKYLRR
jgi:hypothetical protein